MERVAERPPARNQTGFSDSVLKKQSRQSGQKPGSRPAGKSRVRYERFVFPRTLLRIVHRHKLVVARHTGRCQLVPQHDMRKLVHDYAVDPGFGLARIEDD